jgi:hypothetical protein
MSLPEKKPVLILFALFLCLAIGCGENGTEPPNGCEMGVCWTIRESGTDEFLWGTDRSDSLFLAVGFGGTIVSSPDGMNWNTESSGVDDPLYDVLWSGDRFMAVGKNVILSSPDGIAWTQVKQINTMDTFRLEGVASSGSTFAAVDSYSGQILASNDYGESWFKILTGTNGREFWEITCSGSLFVAVGGVLQPGSDTVRYLVATSADGVDWSLDCLGIPGELFDVTWTGTQFVAVGGLTLPADGAPIVTSPDGTTWTSRSVDISDPLLAVGSGGGLIIAVGYNGTIVTSEDGVIWTNRDSGTSNPLYGVSSSEERLVVVGTHGTVLSSP